MVQRVSAHRPTRRRRVAAAVAVLGSFALAGCSSGGSTTVETSQADIAASKSAVPTPVLPATWPLTGVAADGGATVRAALAVKIENSTAARPQTGLEQADMVWEEVVEGGITRFVAVYQSQVPEEVGPIRSVRPMDPKIVGPLKGLIAFSGGQQQYVDMLSAAGLQIFSQDQGADGFYRKKGVAAAPHNVYATPATFWAAADSTHQASPPQQFAHARTAAQATAVVAGTAATNLALTLSGSSHPQWGWDAASSTWLRSEGTTESVSRAGVRMAATNVVVLRVTVQNTSAVDPAGNPVPETVLEGSGEALVATGGKTVTATWTKGAELDPVTLTAADGTTISLAPGNTWVELVPIDGGAVAIS
ncbi:MAG: DUF3048 domain-containing protein [Actinobacteria bacterium]|nr:DUF3048 domain-containing protein [Actinomycetota bacterium]MCG2796965.1 DUF3048 domain-containing protein [Cellulomonas sp.]